MGLLVTICAYCRKPFDYFSFDQDVECTKCKTINTSKEITNSTIAYDIGYKEGSQSRSEWLKSIMSSRGSYDTLEDWYDYLHSLVYKTKEKPEKFDIKISLHAETLLLHMVKLKKEGMPYEQYKRLSKMVYEVCNETEEWEKDRELK